MCAPSALLADATLDGLSALAAVLGFDGAPERLDPAMRTSLGLADELTDVRLMRGRGALRALLVVGPADEPLRSLLASIAASLATRIAHVLWT